MMDISMQGGQQNAGGIPPWLQAIMGGGGAGMAAGGLASLFGMGGGKNPADVANKYISKIPGQTKEFYSPYMEAGKGAMSSLQNQYQDLLGGNVYNKLGEGYKESPGYQYALEQALQAGGNAAAAGGMAGTPLAQQEAMKTAQGLASQDFQNYLNSQMGLYGMGLQGQQGLNQMGFDASKDYASNLANALSQQGAYGYAGQAGQNTQRAGGLSNLFSGLGMLGSAFLPKFFGG